MNTGFPTEKGGDSALSELSLADWPAKSQVLKLEVRGTVVSREMITLKSTDPVDLGTVRMLKATRPAPAESLPEPNPAVITAEACAPCHGKIVTSWRKTPHAWAVATLRAKDKLTSDCLSCHSVLSRVTKTWSSNHPQADEGITCADCHTGSLKHAFTAKASDVVRSPAKGVCLTCHTTVTDPQFNHRTRIARVTHRNNP